MTTPLTMRPLQILLVRAISDWLRGYHSRTNDTTEIGSDHVMVQEVLIEQEIIAWDQFLKGRISKKWGAIQDIWYQR